MVRGTNKDDIGKIFVGGLSTETTKDGLKDHFSEFGNVSDSVVMVDATTKRSRGFGFVTFNDPDSVDKVFEKFEHFLDNKKIDPKRAVPRGPGQQAMLSTQGPGAPPGRGMPSGNSNENKVFVGGLSSHTSEDDLRQFFSDTCGKSCNVGHTVYIMYGTCKSHVGRSE
ncbi:DAZ-associated protein 1 [Desmophyllum pertusum]|uniref:DAZ-associated protein 1 n=1 Tax=Desmophyllum pertusum TaxID=174260 RepID=A0A9W9ZKW6_9CNID|nr:DAZ-associated protein 1 [Desmophyllum pertusum]